GAGGVCSPARTSEAGDLLNDALALIEIGGWAAAMVVLDAMEKMAGVRVLQTELNDRPGVCLKLHGSLADVQAATDAGKAKVEGLGKLIAAHVIPSPSEGVLSLLPK